MTDDIEFWKDRWYSEVLRNVRLENEIDDLKKRVGEQREIIDRLNRDSDDYALRMDIYSDSFFAK